MFGINRWRTALLCACLVLGSGSCGSDDGQSDIDEDLGPIDSTLEFGERIDWPGVDEADGRVIPLIRGFGDGRPASYWFLGFASRETADSFWFCCCLSVSKTFLTEQKHVF